MNTGDGISVSEISFCKALKTFSDVFLEVRQDECKFSMYFVINLNLILFRIILLNGPILDLLNIFLK